MSRTRPTLVLAFILVCSAGNAARAGDGPALPGDFASLRGTVLKEKPVDPATYKIPHEVVVFDLWKYFSDAGITDLAEQADVVYLVTALQGIANQEKPRLYLLAALTLFDLETAAPDNPDYAALQITDLDAFWWGELERKGYIQQQRKTSDLAELLQLFRADVQGLALWGMQVPATVNAACIAAGCDHVLPVSADLGHGRLRKWLEKHVPDVKVTLDLTRRFNGRDPIDVDGKVLPSTGSAKNDVYRFALEKYLKRGASNPYYMWYNCDASMVGTLRSVYAPGVYGHLGTRAEMQHNGMFNTDYWVAKRAFLFDLLPWGDDVPKDDPHQTMGTDLASWNDIMMASYEQRQGEFGVLGGFVPWWIKYTSTTGGKHADVPTEWEFVSLGTSYNMINDGDAAFGIANASFFMHMPQATEEDLQEPAPVTATLQNDTAYVAFCMLDYDSSAWVNQMIPCVYRDPTRGQLPLNWCINAFLHLRVPHAMRYLLENRTPNDYFGIGGDGVGYIQALALTERKGRVQDSGIPAYEQLAMAFNRRYHYDTMAFYIAARFTSPWTEMAAKLEKGFGYNLPIEQQLINGTPTSHVPTHHVHRVAALESDLRAVYQQISESQGYSPSFYAYRCILIKPRHIAAIVDRLRTEFPHARVEFVDLRTYFRLLKEKLTSPLASPWRDAEEVGATPEKSLGLLITPSSGGYFTTTKALKTVAWSVTTQDHGLYMYYNVDDAFAQRNAKRPVQVEVTFLDQGTGRLQLQYDSLDPSAPLDGSYKNATPDLALTNSGKWRTATFLISDARFSNRQNGGADFRFFKAPNDRMVIRDVKVRVPKPQSPSQ